MMTRHNWSAESIIMLAPHSIARTRQRQRVTLLCGIQNCTNDDMTVMKSLGIV